MSDQSPPHPDEIALRREELELRRFEAKLGLRKVIFGTLIVGLAGILVPAAVEGWSLVFKKWQNEAQLDFERQSRQENFLKGHFSTAINEDLELRLRFAQYFAQTIDGYDGATEQTERDGKNWIKYYRTLKQQRDSIRKKILESEERIRKLYSEKQISPEQKIKLDLLEIELNWYYDEIKYVAPERGEKPASSILARQGSPANLVDIPTGINEGLKPAKQSTLTAIFGMPRDTFDSVCRPVLNEPLRSLIRTEDVGPFKATGIEPAITSLQHIFSRIQKDHPETYVKLGTAGMLCARSVRGGTTPLNHSWGTAIDIKVGSLLDGVGTSRDDGKTLAELTVIAPYFNEEGWYWGVASPAFEDGMHFELAEETLLKWHSDGKFGAQISQTPSDIIELSPGDNSSMVRALQEKLAQQGYDVSPTGRYGPATRAAVIEFQSSQDMLADGIAGAGVLRALDLN